MPINVGSRFGKRSISFNFEDQNSLIWLRRSPIGRWRTIVNPICIQEEARIEVVVMSVGEVYGLISFKSSSIRDCAMDNNPDWFWKWFLDVKPWESLDLICSTH